MAIKKAEELKKRSIELTQQEKDMNKKFEETRQKLEQYREQFYKSKKSLVQDHETFVNIRNKEAAKLDTEMEKQHDLEMQTTQAL